MRSIYKYELFNNSLKHELLLNEKDDILSIGLQNGRIMCWVLVDTDPVQSKLVYTFEKFGTGLNAPNEKAIHLETLIDGELVWHIFVTEIENIS